MSKKGEYFQVLCVECHEPWLVSKLAFEDATAIICREFPSRSLIAMPYDMGYLCPSCCTNGEKAEYFLAENEKRFRRWRSPNKEN